MKKLVLNIGLSLLALIGAISCNIKEDMSNCPGSIILDYSAYSDLILDDIDADEQVDIFIFNPEGVCVDRYTFTYGDLQKVGFEFEVPIKYSDHSSLVWHGLNSENYSAQKMAKGESYEDFYLRLVHDANSLSYSGMTDPLWASPFEPIEFCAKITRHRIFMTRIHTQINVTLQQQMDDGSLIDLDVDDFNFAINACNNVYHSDYTISEESCDTEYTEDAETSSRAAQKSALMGTLRITPTMDCKLKVEEKNGGSRITIEGNDYLDLVKYMLDAKDNTELTDQEFLDLNKIWDINLVIKRDKIGYIAVSMKINDWMVWFTNSDLS